MKNLLICIIKSNYNYNITNKMLLICINELYKFGLKKKNIITISVPGVLEIPFFLNEISKLYFINSAIIIGSIIKGQSNHYELISNQVFDKISNISLINKIPIINSILTTENINQAYFKLKEKIINSVKSIIEVINLNKNIYYFNNVKKKFFI